MKRSDAFREAARRIARGARYQMHGRDPAAGLDCVGYVLAVYREVGLGFDRADLPYGRRDQYRGRRRELLHQRLSMALTKVGVDVPPDCRTGDVIAVCTDRFVHVGLCVDGAMWEMTRRGVVVTPLARLWEWVTGVYAAVPR